jgi:hypothetical protein
LSVTKEIIRVSQGGITVIDTWLDVDPKILKTLNDVAVELEYWDEAVEISNGTGMKSIIIAIASRVKTSGNDEIKENDVYLIAKKIIMRMFPKFSNNDAGQIVEFLIGVVRYRKD